MAVDDSGKQARLFPCLAILRYTVATVVTVLAVVVIVMVIAVGVRPDDVSVSVVQGHVGTSDLWNETTTSDSVDVDAEPTATAKALYRGGGPRGRCIGGRGGAPYSALRRSCSGPGGGGGVSNGALDPDTSAGGGLTYRRPPTRVVYTPVDALILEVALSVDNQSGRGSINCGSINVTFYVGGTSTAAAKMEIGELTLPSSFNFHLKPQTSHKISRVVTFSNKPVLQYIADTYGGDSSFTGTVEVTMNTSSVVTQQLGQYQTTPRIVTLVCSPVDFSVVDATATATSVQCIKSN